MSLLKKWASFKTTSFAQKTWEGEEKIVVAIDCGTTFSGVAYSYLFPKGRQSIQRVTQWPGQENQKGEAKIPTLVWYDEKLGARAFGAEALAPHIRMQAEKEEWQLAEHFKLHLHPSTMRAQNNIVVQPLPNGLGIDQIYADFLGYLFKHTKSFFQQQEINGAEIWNKLEEKGRVEIVIAHPNGWGSWEQGLLRKAAVLADIIPSSTASDRVYFVTEAEASVHYVMHHGDMEDRLERGIDLLVCDAGGSTVDTTVYKISKTRPILALKEKHGSACIQAGAIFVNQTATEYFTGLFKDANYDEEHLKNYVTDAIDSFEAGVKKTFEEPNQEDLSIDVGGHRLTDTSIGIRRGRMNLTGGTVEKFFSPWTDEILKSVETQMKGHSIKYILVVGGFGDSPYLRRLFREKLTAQGTEVILANDSTAKAVADGAAMWHIQQSVTARAARFAYGIEVRHYYDPKNPLHAGRPISTLADGETIRGIWHQLVAKDQVVKNQEEVRHPVFFTFNTAQIDLSSNPTYIKLCARTKESSKEKPFFAWNKEGQLLDEFVEVGTVSLEASSFPTMVPKRKWQSTKKQYYWVLNFDVCLLFGKTEIQAQIAWKDSKGNEHRTPALFVPEKFV